MVAGTEWPGGDPFLQRQNEPSIAVSTRNPLHLLAGSNDYRTVYTTPIALECELKEETQNILVTNVPNPEFADVSDLASPDITNPDITNAIGSPSC